MYHVEIRTAKGLHVTDQFVTDTTCMIGKHLDSNLVLRGWRIDRNHAKLVQEDEGIFIYDLSARGGIKVNGKRQRRYGPIRAQDLIEIHDYRVRIVERGGFAAPAGAGSEPDGAAPLVVVDQVLAAPAAAAPPVPPAAPNNDVDQTAALSEQAQAMHEWRVRLRRALHEQMDLRRINVSSMSDEELRELANGLVKEAMGALRELPRGIDRAALTEQVVAEAVGLGPLEPLLARDEVTEIMVNCAHEVFFEQGGRLYKSDVTFTDDQAVQAIIERIVAPTGRRIDESSPMVDARLKDGSRVNAVIPPLALKGSNITIRKFIKHRLTARHFIEFGSLDQAIVDFLEVAVKNRRNIVVSGGTGSGKTTLLNVLSNFVPEHERIVTIEDSAELKLYQPNLVALEGRPPNQEGRGAIAIRDLVRNALRMRPDRIVVGECRGGEALDMLQAMNTGHDGSLTTAHANSPRDCLSRLEVMVMMAGMDLPSIAIREQIASAVNLIVHQSRFASGERKITSIAEVVGIENNRIQLAEVFRFNQTGYDKNGRVQGEFGPTGLVPEFYEGLRRRGVALDMGLFETAEDKP